MPRRRDVPKREVGRDARFGDSTVQKLINTLMSDGKKAVAERIAYAAFDDIERRTKDDPIKVFKRALDNVKPAVEVKSRRVGGSTYQVPIEVRPERRATLALRWMIGYHQHHGCRGDV